MAKFKILMDGGDCNITWYRKVGEGRYHVIEQIDMDQAVGRENEGQSKFCTDLSEVDLMAIGEGNKKSVLRSYGWDTHPPEGGISELMLLEAAHGYGVKAPLGIWNGNNKTKLLKAARAESAALDDPRAYEEAMNRPVNGIGSTAREFMQGDIYSAMDRGVRKGDPKAKLMAKMYGAKEEDIKQLEAVPLSMGVSVSINMDALGQVSDDPLAFAVGYATALRGGGLELHRNDLATEYVRGYQIGVDVKSGNVSKPDWHRG